MSSVEKSAASSIGWNAINKIARQAFQFIFLVILARLLTPSEFGMFSMVLIFTGFADLIKNLGLGAAIIHNQRIETIHLNTAFWTNILMGLTLFILFVLLAPLFSWIYNAPEIKVYFYGLAGVFLLNSLNVVQEALLIKNLKFKRLFILDMASLIPAGIISIIAAYHKMGVWSLVLQNISFITISVSLMWISTKWKPAFQFSRKKFKELWTFSGGLLGYQTVNYFARRGDQFIIGKFIGSEALGIYSRAYHLMLMPITMLDIIISKAMFPILSTLQNDNDRFKQAYLKSVSLIMMFILPIGTVLFVFPRQIILLIYGSNWLEMTFLLRTLSLYTIQMGVGISLIWIYTGLGKTTLLFKWSVFYAIVSIVSILVGLFWGLKGVVISYVIASYTILLVPSWIIAFKLIELKISDLLKRISPYFITAVCLGVVFYFVNLRTENFLPFWLTLCVLVPGLFLSYFGVLLLLKDEQFLYFKSAVIKSVYTIIKRNKN